MTTLYQPGQKVYFVQKPMHTFDKPNTEGVVHHSFIDKDGEERVVVESGDNYLLLHMNLLSDKMGGETNFDKKMKDPKFALQLAIDIGIYNEDGTLTTRYGGEYDLIDGVKYYADDDCQ